MGTKRGLGGGGQNKSPWLFLFDIFLKWKEQQEPHFRLFLKF